MTASPSLVSGVNLPAWPRRADALVPDASGRNTSRRQHHPVERILSGELLPDRRRSERRTGTVGVSPHVTVLTGLVEVSAATRAIAAYLRNAGLSHDACPAIDLFV